MAENQSSPWQVQSLRCTVFVGPSIDLDGQRWWKALFGEDPAEISSKPRMSITHASGDFGSGVLEVNSAPGRVDWNYRIPQEVDRASTVPLLGSFDDQLEQFLGPLLRWLALPEFPGALRIAFGAILLQPVEDRKSGYRLLADYLPAVKIDSECSSDFLLSDQSSLQLDRSPWQTC